MARFANANLRDRRVAEVRLLEPDSRGWQNLWGIRFFYFWNYLKRRAASEGGEERKRLLFYLADYVWRPHAYSSKPKEQAENF